MGHQLVAQGEGNAPPDDGQQQDVNVRLSGLPVRPVEDEFAWLRGGKEGQDNPGDVGRLEGMTVKEALHRTNDGGGLCASPEARREFSMPNVLAPKESEDMRESNSA